MLAEILNGEILLVKRKFFETFLKRTLKCTFIYVLVQTCSFSFRSHHCWYAHCLWMSFDTLELDMRLGVS